MKDPNQLKINFPPDEVIKKSAGSFSYEDDRENPAEDLYGRYAKIKEEKRERSRKKNEKPAEYHQLIEILDKMKVTALKNINLITKKELLMNSKENYEEIDRIKEILKRNNDPQANYLGIWMGILSILRKTSKLAYSNQQDCLKYIEDLPHRGGSAATEIVQSKAYDQILELLKKIK